MALAASAVAALSAEETTGAEDTWVARVTSDDVTVRCGANESYYPLGTLGEGDLVLVTGRRHSWSRIETVGTAFMAATGYVKYPAADASRFTFDETTGIGTANGDIEVLARNIESEELYRSWRPVRRLADGDAVEVLSTTKTDPGTLHREAYVVHIVRLPADSIAWVSATYLEAATPEEAMTFTAWSGAAEDAGSSEPEPTTLVEAEPAPEPEPEPELIMLVEVENAWKKMAGEPIIEAELTPMQDLYVELLENYPEDLVVHRIANGRMEQLKVWSGIQDQKIRIQNLRVQLAAGTKDAEAYGLALELGGDYTAVGRIALSNTFDGRLRPLMYRLQDPDSGRTVGYLPADETVDLSTMLGQVVGVSGERDWDATWRVTVLAPDRLDILSPSTAAVGDDTDTN